MRHRGRVEREGERKGRREGRREGKTTVQPEGVLILKAVLAQAFSMPGSD